MAKDQQEANRKRVEAVVDEFKDQHPDLYKGYAKTHEGDEVRLTLKHFIRIASPAKDRFRYGKEDRLISKEELFERLKRDMERGW